MLGRDPRSLIALVALGCGVALSAVEGSAQTVRKTFGGAVVEAHPEQHWFLMTGGASKKYPRVRISYDGKTRWTGVPLRGRALKIGERVQVIASLQGEVFRAQTVEVLDSEARPGTLPK